MVVCRGSNPTACICQRASQTIPDAGIDLESIAEFRAGFGDGGYVRVYRASLTSLTAPAVSRADSRGNFKSQISDLKACGAESTQPSCRTNSYLTLSQR